MAADLNRRLGSVRLLGAHLRKPFAAHFIHVEQVISAALRNVGIPTGEYDEVFVELADTIDEAKRDGGLSHKRATCTYVALSETEFRSASEAARTELLIRAAEQGLLDLAKRDGLDAGKIAAAFEPLWNSGLETELGFIWGENDDYAASVQFVIHREFSRSPFWLQVVRKADGAIARRDLESVETFTDAVYRYAKLTFTKKLVRVNARKSFRADLHNKSAPRRVEHALADLFPADSSL